MNFLKNNKIIVVLIAVAVIVAVLLGFMLLKRSAEAAEIQDKVQQQKEFFDKIKSQDIAINEQNRQFLENNVDKTKEQLKQLQTKLWQKTNISTRNLNGIKTKNKLRDDVLNMRNKLEKRGISVSESASGLSFGNILQEDKLPDVESEVPIILKQLKIVKEIVNILAQSNIDSVQNAARPFGLKLDNRTFFNIVPFKFTITGSSKAIRKVITALQKDSEYIFIADTISFTTPNTSKKLFEQLNNREKNYRTRSSSKSESNVRRSFRGMDGGTETAEGEEEMEKLPKQARTVPIRDEVTCNIQLNFLEFHNPDKSSTEKKD